MDPSKSWRRSDENVEVLFYRSTIIAIVTKSKGVGRQWSRATEHVTEELTCSHCQKKTYYIVNKMFARCPHCSYYIPREKLTVSVTDALFFDRESKLWAEGEEW